MRRIFLLVLFLCFSASSARAACEIHPAYNAEFRKSLIEALYKVQHQSQLTYILYKLITIDRETTEHEEAHYHAAMGWAHPPVYEIVELYGKKYRIGGCVKPKPGIPLEVAYYAAIAPNKPSAHDLRLAEKYKAMLQHLGRW